MTNAQKIPCALIKNPTDPAFRDVSIRHFQGCPTIAVTPGGRIWLGWYSGGTREPHIDNFNLLVKSDDGGKTWSDPVLIIPSSREHGIHALDIQLWTAPDGSLHVYWVQNNTHPLTDADKNPGIPGQPWVTVDGWVFDDFAHNEWRSICKNPDADDPIFGEPERLDQGFLRCKPLMTDAGRQINFNYDQISKNYCYSISDDGGKTFTRLEGARKLATYFDEGMAYQKADGTIRMLARTGLGCLAQSLSNDNGDTWSEAVPSGIVSADTRFYINRTPSGRVLLIRNNHPTVRTNLTICLSEDDGASWKWQRCIDTRRDLSYPDADFYGDRIFLTYDRERTGAKEILFASFTEEDIITGAPIAIRTVSKP